MHQEGVACVELPLLSPQERGELLRDLHRARDRHSNQHDRLDVLAILGGVVAPVLLLLQDVGNGDDIVDDALWRAPHVHVHDAQLHHGARWLASVRGEVLLHAHQRSLRRQPPHTLVEWREALPVGSCMHARVWCDVFSAEVVAHRSRPLKG